MNRIQRTRSFFWVVLCFWPGILSCSGHLGYGVLLWSENIPGLHNGQIVTIIGESKVNGSYLISFEKTERHIATSRLAFFRHLANAQVYREQFIQYRDWYALNMNPAGLIMRALPQRKAKQVYRLRPRQTIKILQQASAQMSVGNIEGRWYEVLTEDGVRGFTFDYYLRIEDRKKPATEQLVKLAAFETARDELEVDRNSLRGIWYQRRYAELLRSGQSIDLRLLMLAHGQLYLNQQDKQLELYAENSRQSLSYERVSTNLPAELSFNDKQMRAVFLSVDEISFYFRSKDNTETILELQKITPQELQAYRQRALKNRRAILHAIFQNGSQLSSAGLYGTIRFRANGQFRWSSTRALAGILPNAPDQGTLFFPYRLGENLQGVYDQLLTFIFADNQELTFLLKINSGNNALLRYVPSFMIDSAGVLNGDAFNQKLDIAMQFEGRPLIPADLF